MRRKIITRKMTQEEEDELDDTLLAQIDELLASRDLQAAKTKTPEDIYFDELAEMLKYSDGNPLQTVITNSDDDEFDENDFFDTIIKDIPKEQRPKVRFLSQEAREEMDNIINTLEEDIKKSDAKRYAKNKQQAFVKKIPLEIAEMSHVDNCLIQRKGIDKQHELDEQRLTKHLEMIELKIKELGSWSPAKNHYMKILKDNSLTNYDKLQKIVQLANEIVQKKNQAKESCLFGALTRKVNSIHASIADIDINNEVNLDVYVSNICKA